VRKVDGLDLSGDYADQLLMSRTYRRHIRDIGEDSKRITGRSVSHGDRLQEGRPKLRWERSVCNFNPIPASPRCTLTIASLRSRIFPGVARSALLVIVAHDGTDKGPGTQAHGKRKEARVMSAAASCRLSIGEI
jgi:hypothetical protein